MRQYEVVVTQIIRVSLDDAKITPAFMEEFSSYMFPADRLEDHAEHIGQLVARGLHEPFELGFIEGYGDANEMNIVASFVDIETDASEIVVQP